MTILTTLDYMEKELIKHKNNLLVQQTRNAPNKDIICIKEKIKHYEKVCELLREEKKRNETIKK